ncbi:MAG: hypothetical protein LW875_12280 [Proteobacteria bacterium]|jgi:hypothetical protein|nr:hypothetical protein [Pseudomonadota bacterium]
MKWLVPAFVFSVSLFLSSVNLAQSKSKTYRKVQEVNFEEMNLKGTVRNPDGAYLVQKRGIKFMPLYDIQKEMDSKIRESVEYVR